MKPAQRARLRALLAVQAESGRTKTMRKHVRAELVNAGCTVRQHERQLYARKGNHAKPVPFIVAHADTVHPIVEPHRYRVETSVDSGGEIVYSAYDPKTGAARGVGGDDKCGLHVAIETARRLDNVGVIITVDEETGCQGARRVPAIELAAASVLIQADRRGHDDAIMDSSGVEISSRAWRDHVQPIIDSHGYAWSDYGTMTDVSEMVAEHIAHVSAINISAGYYGAHTSHETIRESELENAVNLAVALAAASGGKRWKHTAGRRYAHYRGGWYDDGFGYDDAAWSRAIAQAHNVTRTPRAANFSPAPKDPEPGSLWYVGTKVFRMSEARTWIEVSAETARLQKRANDALALAADQDGDRPYHVIPCDIPTCHHEAEDWHQAARLTLCQRHLDDADTMVSSGVPDNEVQYLILGV